MKLIQQYKFDSLEKNDKKIIGSSALLDFKGAKCYIVEYKYFRQGYSTWGSFGILMIELPESGQRFLV